LCDRSKTPAVKSDADAFSNVFRFSPSFLNSELRSRISLCQSRSAPYICTHAPERIGVEDRVVLSTIGKAIRIDGEIGGAEDLAFDGELQGIVNVPASSCSFGPNSTVKARVIARSVTLAGDFEGEIFATTSVRLLRTAQVRGRLLSPRISIEEGAMIVGNVDRDKKDYVLFDAPTDPANSAAVQGQLAISLS
jgi:cytoskeletal protein CcmA (bactofilin family)